MAQNYSTKTALEQATVPDDVRYVTIDCYASVGDGGGARYVRVAANPDYPGSIQSEDGKWWELDETVGDIRMFGAVADSTSSTQSSTQAIKNAIHWASATGKGQVLVPPGSFTMGALDTPVGDGTGIILGSEHSNVTIRGCGSHVSILKPISNKIEMFAIDGANNTVFEDIAFDNIYVPLQGQTKHFNNEPGGGVNQKGNAANAAIRQYSGENLTIRRLRFIKFIIASHYIGNNDDIAVLAGDFIAEDCEWTGCCQGILLEQPHRILLTNLRNADNIDSVNASPDPSHPVPDDPGHLLYVSNRAGKAPREIIVSNIMDTNGSSSCLKIRKGELVTVSDVTVDKNNRGIEIAGVENGAVSNCSIKLAQVVTADTNRRGLGLEDCGNVTASDIRIDISGVDAWGVVVQPEISQELFNNKNVSLTNIQVVNDMEHPGKNAFLIEGQARFRADFCGLIHTGVAASTRAVFGLTNGCTDARIFRPYYRTPGSPSPSSGRDLLVRIVPENKESDPKILLTTGTLVEYSRFDLDVAPTANTIQDDGKGNTTIIRDGVETGSWTPGFTFTTPGDLVVTTSQAAGKWFRRGDLLKYVGRWSGTIDNLNTGSSSGDLRIVGLVHSAATTASGVYLWPGATGQIRFANTATGVVNLSAFVGAGENFIRFRQDIDNGPGANLAVANFAPSTSNTIVIDVVVEFSVT